jgi:hypothetical protein
MSLPTIFCFYSHDFIFQVFSLTFNRGHTYSHGTFTVFISQNSNKVLLVFYRIWEWDMIFFFFNSMVDEKRDRLDSGLQGSGSKFVCTLCDADRESAVSNLGNFNINRSIDEEFGNGSSKTVQEPDGETASTLMTANENLNALSGKAPWLC